MRTPNRRRQFKGLSLHLSRHPSANRRRLVTRTQRWNDTVMPGLCRWCAEPAARIVLTWHSYCLTAYRIASGQKSDRIETDLCEICGSEADELDHRLSITVAKTLGISALIRAFTPQNLRWLCQQCHRQKTRQDRLLAGYLRGCALDWRSARKLIHLHRPWLDSFLLKGTLEAERTEALTRAG